MNALKNNSQNISDVSREKNKNVNQFNHVLHKIFLISLKVDFHAVITLSLSLRVCSSSYPEKRYTPKAYRTKKEGKHTDGHLQG